MPIDFDEYHKLCVEREVENRIKGLTDELRSVNEQMRDILRYVTVSMPSHDRVQDLNNRRRELISEITELRRRGRNDTM